MLYLQLSNKKLFKPFIMRKIALVAFLVIAGQAVIAQTQFGIKGGVNFSNWAVKFDGEKDDEYKSRTGFHFGIVVDHAISENFSIQPQVLYVSKGTSVQHEDHKDQIVMNAIDIPLNFLYKAPAGKGKFFVGGGPNFGFNLGGTVKSDEEDEDGTDVEIGDQPGEVKGFDFGLNFLAGYELPSGLFVSANYTPGISNLGNAPSGVDFTTRSNYFGISLGYMLGKKNTK
jgi:hypothetical protein